LQGRRLKERNQGQQQQGQELGWGSRKGVHLAYFAGAPAEGEESGATTEGVELGIIRGSRKGVNLAYFAGAPTEGEESGATTAGAGVGYDRGSKKGVI
jgi:hypothetical protein